MLRSGPGRHGAAVAVFACCCLLAQPGALRGGLDGADTSAMWQQAQQLTHDGEDAQAAALYAQIAATTSTPSTGVSGLNTAPRALLQQAQAARAAGDSDAASAALDTLLASYGSSDQAPAALLVQAQLRHAAGDCDGTQASLAAYQQLAGATALQPYVALLQSACYGQTGDWADELAAAQQARTFNGGGPRLARIEGDERMAEANLKLGNTRAALDADNDALSLAGTRSYTSEMLFTTAGLARKLGDTSTAVQRYRALVVDYPEQARAAGALNALADMGRLAVVSPYQAGVVRLDAGAYQAAIDQFDQVGAGDPDAGAAAFNRAVAVLRLGQDDDAVQAMQAVAQDYPDQAATALLRAGRVLESDGQYAQADDAYQQLARLAPGTADAAQALFRAGLTRFIRDDASGALDAWSAAAAISGSSGSFPAQVQFWRGKALAARDAGDASAAARAAWQQAVAASPATYYGLRAADLLAGQAIPQASAIQRDPARLTPSAAEDAEFRAWLKGLHQTPEQVQADLTADPHLALADQLLSVGLTDQASWEIEPVLQGYAKAKDLAHLAGLGTWLMDRDQVNEALQVGRQIVSLAGGDPTSLPREVQRLAYPAGWGTLAYQSASQSSVDPLLLLALVRQESAFNPAAVSGARAMGLTQVVPSTGSAIASQLGLANSFQASDLLRPSTSLRFGATYLASMLKLQSGAVLPSLAAYNAGGGAVSRWLASMPDGDPDLFVEQVPYAETQTYVKVVYENYRQYVRLYG